MAQETANLSLAHLSVVGVEYLPPGVHVSHTQLLLKIAVIQVPKVHQLNIRESVCS